VSTPAIQIVPFATAATEAVERLLDHVFGTDRHERTAYRVRGAADPIGALSFVAMRGDALIGSIQCWPILLTTDDGRDLPLVMVGPVAVAPDHQGDGVGRMLVTASIDAAIAEQCGDALMLIGDPEYYGRFFGFTAARTGAWRLPGPVEMRRLLARGDAVPGDAGMLGPVTARVDAG
jgi:predicted N-acetyltransferase YhbS